MEKGVVLTLLMEEVSLLPKGVALPVEVALII